MTATPTPTYRLGRHPRRPDHPALLNADGTVAHTFAYNADRAEIIGSLEHAGLMLHSDDTVTPDGTPPNEDGEIAASAAAALVLAEAQSPLSLGRQLAAADRAYSAFDTVALRQGAGENVRDGDEAQTFLYDRIDALRVLISTTPATSLQDAAVLISESLTVAGRLSDFNSSGPITEDFCRRLERMLYSALPLVAQAAGLGMEEMNWADRDTLRMARYAGVGVQS